MRDETDKTRLTEDNESLAGDALLQALRRDPHSLFGIVKTLDTKVAGCLSINAERHQHGYCARSKFQAGHRRPLSRRRAIMVIFSFPPSGKWLYFQRQHKNLYRVPGHAGSAQRLNRRSDQLINRVLVTEPISKGPHPRPRSFKTVFDYPAIS